VNANFVTARLLPLAFATLVLPGAAFAQSEPSTALAQCLSLAGTPDNTLPASQDLLAALRAAAPFCDEAIAEGAATADVHFLMGVLQQNDGALALAMDHFRTAAWLAMQGERPAMSPETQPADVAAEEVISEAQDENAAEAAALPAPETPNDAPTPEVDTARQSIAAETGEGALDADEKPAEAEMAEAVMPDQEPEMPPEGDAPATDLQIEESLEDNSPATIAIEESNHLQAEPLAPAAQCAALAGPPDSGVPVSPAALESSLAALRLARPYCEQAIADGTATAETHFQLAVLLQNEGKHGAALEHFRIAADMGLAAAHAKLGDYALFGIGPVKPDVDEAVAEYRIASGDGDLAATTTLAFLYRLGRGVPRDPSQMMQLMTTAADGGYQFAQYRLAQTYLTGDGIAGGADEALGVPNPERGAKYLELAARQGNSKAILELAQLYADDSGGVAWDPDAHAYWTIEAAKTGDPEAIAALGLLYEKGRGVEKDPQRAAELYVQVLETGKVSFADMRKGAARRIPAWDQDTAVAFQLILQERGLYEGAIDGIIGPLSARAATALAR